LASLYGISGKKEQSLPLFNKILTNTNDDPLMAMEVAEMYEETDGAKALECK
jgi:RNA polymerase-associated protein CTR9